VQNRPWLRLFIPTLYTVPPQLVLHAQLPVEFMPMVKLHPPGDPTNRRAPGYQALRTLVVRRIPLADVQALFGDIDEAAARVLIDKMIEQSGGYPRVLIQILSEMLLNATPTVSAASFQRCLRRLADRFRAPVRFYSESVPWLARVALHHTLEARDEEERGIGVRMIQYNVVLAYLNGYDWWDVHPWIREMDEIEAEIATIQRVSAAGAGT